MTESKDIEISDKTVMLKRIPQGFSRYPFFSNSNDTPALNSDCIRLNDLKTEIGARVISKAPIFSKVELDRLNQAVIIQNMHVIAQEILNDESLSDLQCRKLLESVKTVPSTLLLSDVSSIDWISISKYFFSNSRTSDECRSAFFNMSDPNINRTEFTSSDIKRLHEVADIHGCREWAKIAHEFGDNRTPFDCLVCYQRSNPKLISKKFTKEDDENIKASVVRDHGFVRSRLCMEFDDHTGDQLLNRFRRNLNPMIKRAKWSLFDDCKLYLLYKAYGFKNMNFVSASFSERSDQMCYDRYDRINPFVRRGKWTSDESEALVRVVEEIGSGNWKRVSNRLNELCDLPGFRSDELCRHQYLLLSKKKCKKVEKKEKSKKSETKKRSASHYTRTIVCSACNQPGHNRRSSECPKRLERE